MAERRAPAPQIDLSTVLNAPVTRVWQLLQRPATLLFLSRGWLSFQPVDPPTLPEKWQAGEYAVRLIAHGFVPLGQQVLGIEFPEAAPPRRALRDCGHGRLVQLWDHLIVLEPLGELTRYTDQVQVDAGWYTPLLLPWVRGFYAHRQRRWHKLVADRGAFLG